MKNILYLILLFPFTFSCLDSNKTTLIKTDKSIIQNVKIDTIQVVNKPSRFNTPNIQIDTIRILIEKKFPFGYDSLSTFDYPKIWPSDPYNYGRLQNPEGKEFENIGNYYNNLNSSKTIKSPSIEGIKTFIFGDIFDDYYFDIIAYKAIDSCKYRLPNISIYECYYYVKDSEKGTYGNLLLLDPKTKIGKILNVYYDYSGDQNTNMRYFFINHEIINIYEGYCYDDGCSLYETFRILINSEGKIILNEI